MAFGYSPVAVVLLLTSPVLSKRTAWFVGFVFSSRFNGCLVPALARGSVSQVGRVMGADPMSRSSCKSLSSPWLGADVKKRASDDWGTEGAKADQSVRPNHNPREDRRDDSKGLPNEELLPPRDSSRRELVERTHVARGCARRLRWKCLTCKLSIQWASHLRWLQGVIENRSRGTSSQGADLSKSSTAAGCFGKSSQARRRTNVFKVTILQWKSPRHWHQGGTDAKSRVACPRKVVRGTRRRRGKLHQDDRCKFGERPSTLWRPVTSCTIILPVEKGSSSPASRRHRCEVSRHHSA